MVNVCTLKQLPLVLLACLSTGFCQQSEKSLSGLVTQTLVQGISGVEVNPIPSDNPTCLAIAPIQGPNGTQVVSPKARLLNVEGDSEDVLRELSVKFGGTGLKVGNQLVLLTGDLNWQTANQQKGGVLLVNFERGPFVGFFNGGTRKHELVKLALAGNELCVVEN